MKKLYFLSVILTVFTIFPASFIKAQGGVAVNAAGSPPDASALFDVSGTDKGVLIPRVTTAQRNAIPNPAKGLFVYNTDCDVVNYNAGTPSSPNWVTMSSSNALIAGVNITANPLGGICSGTTITYTATPSQSNLLPTYQWQVNGVNVGTNSTVYADSTLNNGDVVTCILSSSAACVSGSPATSNAITVLVNTSPTITGTQSDTFCSGNSATLSATASAGAINWYSAATGGSSLATGTSYTISGLNATSTYYVDATANGCITPTRTAVTAVDFPGAPDQPGSISGPSSISRDSSATYSISSVSYATSYTWTVSSGTITSGQGSNSINVTWGNNSGTGTVSVVANNLCGTSPSQTLSVSIGSETFSYSGSFQNFTVPPGSNSIVIEAWGAQGANGINSTGGYGAYMKGTFSVSPGDVLVVGVGQQAPNNLTNGGGGGGSSGVKTSGGTILIVAGGGGGGGNNNTNHSFGDASVNTSGQSTYGCGGGTLLGSGGTGGNGGQAGTNPCGDWPQGSGGAGVYGNGQDASGSNNASCTGGLSTGAGGQAGINAGNPGGFGFTGGGGCSYGGGGGGGYSGGAGGAAASGYIAGGGGGSYNNGTNQTNTAGVQSGNGQVVISW